jgi:hypothetical protein
MNRVYFIDRLFSMAEPLFIYINSTEGYTMLVEKFILNTTIHYYYLLYTNVGLKRLHILYPIHKPKLKFNYYYNYLDKIVE